MCYGFFSVQLQIVAEHCPKICQRLTHLTVECVVFVEFVERVKLCFHKGEHVTQFSELLASFDHPWYILTNVGQYSVVKIVNICERFEI